jgi:hypothetical protein
MKRKKDDYSDDEDDDEEWLIIRFEFYLFSKLIENSNKN